ncbi:MAG: protein translocase subunit SecDF [Clostridiales bacterium]|nr:MAG: protein translocase subunit SecDF [Clostridiales bacterium]HJA32079.1 protein translocase subunit SecD [Candidatus Eisenbergiella pullicola]
MNRKKGIITLIAAIVALIGFTFVAVFGLDANKTGSASNIKLGLDLAGGVSITYEVVGEEEPSAADMSDTIFKLQQRVENYSTEAQVYQEGSDRINIEIPGVSDANAILEELGKPGSLVFLDEDGNEVLNGTDIADAQAAYQQNSMGNQEPVVSLTMTEEGTEKFAEATKAAAPNHEIIYIVYDDEVVSYPSVQDEITDGHAVINGMSSYEEAEQLASTIRIGGLKLELQELRSNVVGAQLGSDAIRTSLIAGAVGLVLVIIFMIAVYWIPGVASSIALCLYTAMMVLLLNGFDITLTLPGIAGIILSIGMAVDANVIIFARIREEIATGKTVKSSIKIGFHKALSAIIDGNVTTLIAAAVLGFMGTGTIRGFAQTLALGIVLSMFTALTVTQLILNALYAVGFRDEKFYGRAKERKPIGFLRKKPVFFALSAVMILSGFVFMGINQKNTGEVLNYSLEFMGGTSTDVTFNEDMSIEELDEKVVPIFEEISGDPNVQTQKVQGSNEVIFKTRALSVDQREELNGRLAEEFGVDESSITAETISSTISSETRTGAVVAVLVAALCMLVYIWFRFKDIRFGASSVAALLHDVLVVLAFYAISRISVGGTFIACMLTIVGYSINATIVIFDRIRENLRQSGSGERLEEVVDRSIAQTLSRSIFTSLTTFITIAALFVLGVPSIREFALPLMVGIVCGAYSSVCLAGAMWYILRTKVGKKESAKGAKAAKAAK